MKKEGKFYYIGEVSKITGIPAHIIRYWEKEFNFLKPLRDHRGHRIYTEKEIERLNKIKLLVYKDGYKIIGAKKKIRKKETNIEIEKQIIFLKKLLKILKEIKKCLQ